MQVSTTAQQAAKLSLSAPKSFPSKSSLYVVNGLPAGEDAIITSLIEPTGIGERWAIYRNLKTHIVTPTDRYDSADEALLALARIIVSEAPK